MDPDNKSVVHRRLESRPWNGWFTWRPPLVSRTSPLKTRRELFGSTPGLAVPNIKRRGIWHSSCMPNERIIRQALMELISKYSSSNILRKIVALIIIGSFNIILVERKLLTANHNKEKKENKRKARIIETEQKKPWTCTCVAFRITPLPAKSLPREPFKHCRVVLFYWRFD